jgi:hypothetical protein
MFTPILLTLLDESQTDVKLRSLRIFNAFWLRCPAGLMEKVALDEVFADAVFPSSLYLPSLTLEDESIQLLNATYPALFQIAGLAFPEHLIGNPTMRPTFSEKQKSLLDKIMLQGLVAGYNHASTHVRIVELICSRMESLINGMGIFGVRYLKVRRPDKESRTSKTTVRCLTKRI